MTREEQTDWLCRLRAELNNGVIFTPWNKEFTEALTGILEQEPKIGHWIDGFGGSKCSGCGCLEAGHSDYCPNCGAKMEVQNGKET